MPVKDKKGIAQQYIIQREIANLNNGKTTTNNILKASRVSNKFIDEEVKIKTSNNKNTIDNAAKDEGHQDKVMTIPTDLVGTHKDITKEERNNAEIQFAKTIFIAPTSMCIDTF